MKDSKLPDIVIACECLHWPGCTIFEEDPLPSLATTIAELVGDHGDALVAFRQRAATREERFFQMCRDLGLEEASPRLRLDKWVRDNSDETEGSDATSFWLARLRRKIAH